MIATPIPREMLLHAGKSLPAAPRIMALLGHLLLDPNSEMSEIASLLRRDIALTACIIRISNSPFYNPGPPYGSLDEALARVGFTEVYRLTGLAAVAQISKDSLPVYGVTGPQVRENALLTALIMEELARRVGMDPRHAYTAGLMRSVGKITFDRMTRTGSYSGSYKAEHGKLGAWETMFVGLTNCEGAAVILEEWRFPESTIHGIRDHYLLGAETSPLAQLLNLAAGFAEKAGFGLPGESDYWLTGLQPEREPQFTEKDLQAALQRALELFGPLRVAVS